ncbi:hypothetical protein ACDF64_14470 [Agromyces sp. MMS24-JH15]|uniref:hypothetical protein n=1 Tax=Agromyces sp. MMS24-JH15 TaxID=3243765 RepID=UPI00374A5AE8
MSDSRPPAPGDEEGATRELLRKFDWERNGKFEDAIIGVVVGALDRAKNATVVVQSTSAALVTIYTGIVGLVYSSTGVGLPWRGVVAPLFFGAAVVLTAFYSSFLDGVARAGVASFPTRGTTSMKVAARINSVVAYVTTIAGRRSWALRASVIALGFGLVAIVFPFVDDEDFSMTAGVDEPAEEWISVQLPKDPPPGGLPEPLQEQYFQAQIDEAVTKAEAERAAQQSSGASGATAVNIFALAWLVAGGVCIGVIANPRPKRKEQAASAPADPA